MVTVRKGSTRIVFLSKKYAFKLPYWRFGKYRGFHNFLMGIIGNLTEVEFGKCNFPELAPVVFNISGFLVIMPRAQELTKPEWYLFDIDKHFKLVSVDICERKRDSFGKINGKIVAVDYGG